VVDLRAPLDHIIDPVQVAEALERMRLVLLGKVAEDEIDQRRVSTMLREFYDVHGDAPVELAHDPRCGFVAMGPGQIQWSLSASQGRRGRG
jgi:hypothetical protein